MILNAIVNLQLAHRFTKKNLSDPDICKRQLSVWHQNYAKLNSTIYTLHTLGSTYYTHEYATSSKRGILYAKCVKYEYGTTRNKAKPQ